MLAPAVCAVSSLAVTGTLVLGRTAPKDQRDVLSRELQHSFATSSYVCPIVAPSGPVGGNA